jgi:hypothetical protein
LTAGGFLASGALEETLLTGQITKEIRFPPAPHRSLPRY